MPKKNNTDREKVRHLQKEDIHKAAKEREKEQIAISKKRLLSLKIDIE